METFPVRCTVAVCGHFQVEADKDFLTLMRAESKVESLRRVVSARETSAYPRVRKTASKIRFKASPGHELDRTSSRHVKRETYSFAWTH